MHTGGRGERGYTSCSSSKDFEKLDHKNAIKHKNRGPSPRFSHITKYPPSKQSENDCASKHKIENG
jgi:hypothetical protein